MPDDPGKDTKKKIDEANAAFDRIKKSGTKSADDAKKILDIGKQAPKPKKP